MRLELLFELDRAELPTDNKSIWISFLKNTLTNCNAGKYYDCYFSGTSRKDYTFSIILTRPRFGKNIIQLENNQVKMVFSSDDRNKTGLIFYSAFIQMKYRRFPLPDGNSMILKQVKQLREQLIMNSKVIFRTVTGGGLVVRDHNRETNKDYYYTILDSEFDENLRKVLKVQAMEAGFPEYMAENIKMIPIQCRKVVVKQYGIYVDATVGIFQLEANPDLLQYFYQAGIGSKHSMGYGLLDIITQEE